MSAITVSQETIDPATAATMLAANTHNRGIRLALLNQMTRDINEGNWVLNGESIKFAEDGMLIDGQHRLMAIVNAAKPIDTVVIRGLTASAQDTIDSGSRRTFGDTLRLAGEHHYTILAAATRMAWLLDVLGTPLPGTGNPSKSELLNYLSNNPNLRDWAALGAQVVQSAIRLPASVMGIAYHMSRLDPEAATEFWRQLLENDAEKGSPVFILREQLIKDRLASHPSSVTHRAALITKAWNYWVSGRPITQLTWRPGIEDFPRLRGPVVA